MCIRDRCETGRQLFPTDLCIRAAGHLTQPGGASRSFVRAHQDDPSGAGFLSKTPRELSGLVINGRRAYRAAYPSDFGSLDLEVSLGQDNDFRGRLRCNNFFARRKEFSYAVQAARESNRRSRLPTLGFGQAVVPPTPAKGVLLPTTPSWKKLEHGAGVVVESAYQIGVELVVNVRGLQRALHRFPMPRAAAAEVVHDARRTQLEFHVLVRLAVQQPKRISFKTFL